MLTACQPSSDKETSDAGSNTAQQNRPDNSSEKTTAPSPLVDPVIALIMKTFTSSLTHARELSQLTTDFVKQPDDAGLQALAQSWKQSHDSYQTSELLRGFSLVHPDLDVRHDEPEVVHPVHIRLDQYPMIPGYLDSVPGYPISGLVFQETPLTEAFLNLEHQFSDRQYVALGFHAYELMLKGAEGIEQHGSPERFATLGSQNSDESAPEFRRSLYLLLLAKQIESDIARLVLAWQDNEGFYITTLKAMPAQQFEQRFRDIMRLELARLNEQQDMDMAPGHASPESLEIRRNLLTQLVALYADNNDSASAPLSKPLLDLLKASGLTESGAP